MKPRLSENEFQRQVLALARLCGWRVAHFRPALTRGGRWVTPVQADGKGFPDLVMARGQSLLFVELKADDGALTAEQSLWLVALQNAGAKTAVWRPRDWPEIERVLT